CLCENQPDDTATGRGAGGGPAYVDAFGHAYHDSPGLYLAKRIREALGLRARYDKPGALQKSFMAAASSVDLREAERCGRAGVEVALSGRTDQMVTLVRDAGPEYHCRTSSAPLSAIANRQKRVPDEFIA